MIIYDQSYLKHGSVALCVLTKCLSFCRATFDQIAEININIDAGHDSVSSRPRAPWRRSRNDFPTGSEQRFLNYGPLEVGQRTEHERITNSGTLRLL